MNMTPNDPRTDASTCKSSGTQPENSEAFIARIQALTVKEMTSKAHMQEHTNKGSWEKQPRRKPRRTGPKWAWADRPSTLRVLFGAPFSLGVCLFISSAAVGRHIEQIILLSPFTRNRRRKMRQNAGGEKEARGGLQAAGLGVFQASSPPSSSTTFSEVSFTPMCFNPCKMMGSCPIHP
jgi:hypothetical protein